MPSGQKGAMLRAYDKATGKDAGALPMPAPQTGSPIAVLGAGSWGTALAIQFARSGKATRLWGRDQGQVAQILRRADLYSANLSEVRLIGPA